MAGSTIAGSSPDRCDKPPHGWTITAGSGKSGWTPWNSTLLERSGTFTDQGEYYGYRIP